MQRAKIAPLHSSLGNKSETLSQKKKKKKKNKKMEGMFCFWKKNQEPQVAMPSGSKAKFTEKACLLSLGQQDPLRTQGLGETRGED